MRTPRSVHITGRVAAALWVGLAAWGCASGGAGAAGGGGAAASPATPVSSPSAPSAAAPSREGPALEEIRAAELRADLFALASDAMRGRMASTIDELRAALWLAERAREAGLEPAGDDGTYLQWFPLQRARIRAGSRVALDGAELELWRDVSVSAPVRARVDTQLVWVGEGSAAELAGRDLRGKAVAARMRAPSPLPPEEISLRSWRYTWAALRGQARALEQAGAAAVLLVADSVSERAFADLSSYQRDGAFRLDDAAQAPSDIPVLWVPARHLERVRAARRLSAALEVDRFTYPSANVVARVAGTDPGLRHEHVLFSAHHDHDGVRPATGGDSIKNGADDNATTSVALLAIGRAFAAAPAPRSVLFVWHGAEERGLLGSRWFVRDPVVPLTDIVAALNGDMLGRNPTDSAALLGANPPYRSSVELVAAALEANERTADFAIDYSWDTPAHPENWFFRSDHLPYAQAGVPSLFFTSLLHPEYHTVEDDPETIDVPKLTDMTRWMYMTGWRVASAAERPTFDPTFRAER